MLLMIQEFGVTVLPLLLFIELEISSSAHCDSKAAIVDTSCIEKKLSVHFLRSEL